MSSSSDTGAIIIGARIATGTIGTPIVPADIMAGATTGTLGIMIAIITATAMITAIAGGQV